MGYCKKSKPNVDTFFEEAGERGVCVSVAGMGMRGIVRREAQLLSFKKEQNLGYRGTRDCFVFHQFGHNSSPPCTTQTCTKSPDMPKTREIKCSSIKDIFLSMGPIELTLTRNIWMYFPRCSVLTGP